MHVAVRHNIARHAAVRVVDGELAAAREHRRHAVVLGPRVVGRALVRLLGRLSQQVCEREGLQGIARFSF